MMVKQRDPAVYIYIYTAVNQTKSSFRSESHPIYQELGDDETHFPSATESLQFILFATRWQC